MSNMRIWHWTEEHKGGNPHYHIYCDVLTQKDLFQKILEALNELMTTHGLAWRDSNSVWDEKKRRMYLDLSLVRQSPSMGRGRPYRIHISLFGRAQALFQELMNKLGAVESENEE